MKDGELIAAMLLALCLGVFIGWYSKNCGSLLSTCYSDLVWAIDRGVKAEAKFNECRQGK